jgi:hypothetical protein
MLQAIETHQLHNQRLRLDFIAHSDRLSHTISLISDAGPALTVLESVEGDAHDTWPPSPPFQSLSLLDLPSNRQAALLVGMAGTSHWSATVEPAADAPALIFDIACRHTQPPVHLGNRYRRLPADAGVLVEPLEGTLVSEEQGCLSIVPQAAAVQRGTSRWKYAVRLVS